MLRQIWNIFAIKKSNTVRKNRTTLKTLELNRRYHFSSSVSAMRLESAKVVKWDLYFPANSLSPPPPHTHLMDMRNNKLRNVLTQVRVKFSQSQTSSLLRGEGVGGVKILVTTGEGGRGVQRKNSKNDANFCLRVLFPISTISNDIIISSMKRILECNFDLQVDTFALSWLRFNFFKQQNASSRQSRAGFSWRQ